MINYSVGPRINPKDKEAAPLYHANAQCTKVMDMDEFSKHIASHGCVYKRHDIQAVLTMAVDCLREMLLNGGSPFYTFEVGMGASFLPMFGYYLASPFSLIVALFPREMITEALLTMFLLKTGLCGLTFGVYLHKTRPRNPVAVVIFSTM